MHRKHVRRFRSEEGIDDFSVPRLCCKMNRHVARAEMAVVNGSVLLEQLPDYLKVAEVRRVMQRSPPLRVQSVDGFLEQICAEERILELLGAAAPRSEMDARTLPVAPELGEKGPGWAKQTSKRDKPHCRRWFHRFWLVHLAGGESVCNAFWASRGFCC